MAANISSNSNVQNRNGNSGLDITSLDTRGGGGQFLVDTSRERDRKAKELAGLEEALARLLSGEVNLGDPALGVGGNGEQRTVYLGPMADDEAVIKEITRKPHIKQALGTGGGSNKNGKGVNFQFLNQVSISLKNTNTSTSSFAADGGGGSGISSQGTVVVVAGPPLSRNSANNNTNSDPSTSMALTTVAAANATATNYPEAESGEQATATEAEDEEESSPPRFGLVGRTLAAYPIITAIVSAVLLLFGAYCFVAALSIGLASPAQPQKAAETPPSGGSSRVVTTIAVSAATVGPTFPATEPSFTSTIGPSSPGTPPLATSTSANNNSNSTAQAQPVVITTLPAAAAATQLKPPSPTIVAIGGGSSGGDLTEQHQNFLAPSQLSVPEVGFSATSNIIRARADTNTGSPIAAPPKGVIYQWGSYPGEAPGNVVLVGDYDTLGKPLVELLQQNDLVTVVDRLGNAYVFKVLNYERLTDLMTGSSAAANGPILAATSLPTSTTTITSAPDLTKVSSSPVAVHTSPGISVTNTNPYAALEVLYQTRYDDLSLLAMPANSTLSVLTLVSMARPEDNNPAERLVVRGVLVAYKPIKQAAPIGTPVGISGTGWVTDAAPISGGIDTTLTAGATSSVTTSKGSNNSSSNKLTPTPPTPVSGVSKGGD